MQTRDGGYILGGTFQSGISGDKSEINQGSYHYWVVKLDAVGQKQWDKTIGNKDDDLLFSLQQTRDGDYILGGSSLSGIYGGGKFISSDYWVVKISDPSTDCNTSVQSFTLMNADTHKTFGPCTRAM